MGAFDFLRIGHNLCICTHQGFLGVFEPLCVCLKVNPQKQHIGLHKSLGTVLCLFLLGTSSSWRQASSPL